MELTLDNAWQQLLSENRQAYFHCADCLPSMRAMPANSVDLVFCSPPYEAARTYGIDYKLRDQDYVDWCVERFVECLRVSRGLVAWVVEGQTRQFRYSATPALLMADLHRRGVKLRKPPIFHRVGIPGSGGPDWLRNDYEFIVCASHGKLLWSDNTAMGHPPKWASGGDPSHRMTNGRRVHKLHTKADPNGKRQQGYNPPEKANPGNVIAVDGLRSLNIISKLESYAKETNTTSTLRELREAITSKSLCRWWCRVLARVYEAEILQSSLQGRSADASERPEVGWPAASWQENRTPEKASRNLREMRNDKTTGSSPQRRRCNEQLRVESASALHDLPSEGTQDRSVFNPELRQAILVDGLLLDALPEIQEIWQSIDEGTQPPLEATESGNLITCKVGGGLMGSPLAHLNEAPFPTCLAEFFIRSFCPPSGIVLDPFAGSGTTLAAAIAHGRRGIAIDIRPEMISLTKRRVKESLSKLATVA